jgi:hypothetical protein
MDSSPVHEFLEDRASSDKVYAAALEQLQHPPNADDVIFVSLAFVLTEDEMDCVRPLRARAACVGTTNVGIYGKFEWSSGDVGTRSFFEDLKRKYRTNHTTFVLLIEIHDTKHHLISIGAIKEDDDFIETHPRDWLVALNVETSKTRDNLWEATDADEVSFGVIRAHKMFWDNMFALVLSDLIGEPHGLTVKQALCIIEETLTPNFPMEFLALEKRTRERGVVIKATV